MADVNASFYREFGLAYDRARQLRLRPRQALLTANPWMTASQCNTYLKRARERGLVNAPARGTARTPAPVVITPTTPAPTTPAPQRPRNGVSGQPRRQAVAGWTPEQSGDVWFHEQLETKLRSAMQTGQPVTPEQLRSFYPGRLTDLQARAVLDYAVASGYAERAGDGIGVHPTG